MRGFIKFFFVTILISFVYGCISPGDFDYPPDNVKITQFKQTVMPGKTVIVEKFKDFRGNLFDINSFYLYMVPLIPYGYVQYDRPEEAKWMMSVDYFNFNPTMELAEAATYSFNNSNLFKNVQFHKYGTEMKSDYVLNGAVLSTYYQGKPFSYGLMSGGPFLWLIGFPAGTATNRLAVYLTLTDSQSGKIIWEYGYSNEKYKTLWFYANHGKGIQMYSELMAEAMNAAIKDMRLKLSGSGRK